jgi:hypothetical protein
VELTPILRAAGLGSQELGWLKLDYTGGYLNFGAQLTLYPTSGGVGVDSPISLSTDFKSRDRYSAFWMPEGGIAKIAISNPSDARIHVQMHCGRVDEDFVVSANGTKVKTMSIEDLNGLFPLPVTPASCQITSDAAVSTLRVVGSIKAKSGYAAPIRFYDPATATASSLSAVGIETSAETHVVVRNLTDQPVVVSLARGLMQLNSAGIDRATVTLKTNAPIGSWVGSLTQIVALDKLVEDIPLRTANIPRNAGGSYPLRWDDDYKNLITVTNTSSAVPVARALITAGTATYILKEQTIQPGRTAVYDVDAIRSTQTKDMNGLVLPLAATYGKFIWFDASLGTKLGLMGRNSVVSHANRRKSSFSCGNDCGFTWDYYPIFSNNPIQFTSSGGTFGGTITGQSSLSSGQLYNYPYPFSETQLTSSSTDILTYTVDPGSNSSYVATAGSVGTVTASYVYHYVFAGYDYFDECTPDYNQITVEGDAGTNPTANSSGYKNIALRSGSTSDAVDTINLTAAGSDPNNGTYLWTANNANVSLTNANQAVVTVKAVAIGTSTLTVTYSLNNETATSYGDVQVVQPASLAITADTGVLPTFACPSYPPNPGYNGPERSVAYTINYTAANNASLPIQADVLISESFSPITTSGQSCGSNPSPTIGSRAGGGFTDHFYNCSSVCGPLEPVRNFVPY